MHASVNSLASFHAAIELRAACSHSSYGFHMSRNATVAKTVCIGHG